MDVIALQDTAFDVGGIGRATFQAFDRRGLIPKGLQKSIGKTIRIKRLIR